MPSFIKHPIVKIVAGLIGILAVLFVALTIINLSTLSTGLSSESISNISSREGYSNELFSDQAAASAPNRETLFDGGFIPAVPTPNGYVPNLEAFETTSYYLAGRVRDFETACDTLTNLKADDRYHFKSLTSNLNSCNASFFTKEAHVAEALAELQSFSGVQTSRNTESVTRHREQIQGQSSIVRQQLSSVERTLAEAEIAYDEIATFARTERNVTEYSKAIDAKLQKIDQLTSRKISLTSQLSTLAQQAADLEERIGVVELRVNFNRSNTLNPNKASRAWEQAWNALSETWTNFGIGLTAYLGIFTLFVIQYGLYLLVVIVFARVGWKVVRKIWKL